MAMVVSAVDAYSVKQVRDPRVLAQRLSDDFTSVVSTSDAARVAVLESTAVTNATLTQGKVSFTNVFAGATNVYSVCTNVAITLIRQ
jgi:hypothetical protein